MATMMENHNSGGCVDAESPPVAAGAMAVPRKLRGAEADRAFLKTLSMNDLPPPSPFSHPSERRETYYSIDVGRQKYLRSFKFAGNHREITPNLTQRIKRWFAMINGKTEMITCKFKPFGHRIQKGFAIDS